MIISRAPLRISLGGGGTDLPFYANKFGGSLITASINRYVYIMIGSREEKNIKLNYSKTELVEKVDDIQHPLIKHALKLTGIENDIEIHSMADLPSGSGLGSSSAFLVGLLNGLHYFNGEIVSKYKLAEDCSHITMDILKEPCGKQDQYASAFGNLNHLKIATNGKVTVTPINISHENIKKLEKNLMIFFTGLTRSANDVLGDQKKRSEQKHTEQEMYNYYHEIKKIGEQSKKCLENGNLTRFGEWMNIHWELKKNLSKKMTTSKIDEWYKLALSNGALGGKIIGAGGGGFLMLYVDNNHERIKDLLEKEGLKFIPFKFDFDGTRIIYKEN
jgi:D-glycero-alpha-D-manno-heptose-7-phosphate kinase